MSYGGITMKLWTKSIVENTSKEAVILPRGYLAAKAAWSQQRRFDGLIRFGKTGSPISVIQISKMSFGYIS